VRLNAHGSRWRGPLAALFGTLLLLTNRSFPAMFLLLFFGAIVGLIKNPDFIH
jgi:hypothetical protein